MRFIPTHTAVLADTIVSNIIPASLRLGAVSARGSPGITLYLADLQLGKHAIKVCLHSSL